jgi:hypothetical protein
LGFFFGFLRSFYLGTPSFIGNGFGNIVVVFMKRLQTGMRVDAEVWGAYRVLCSRERVRPSRPIEEFLRLMVDNDSTSSLLVMLREAVKSGVEGYDARARVLLDWYTHGKFWTYVQDVEVSVEGMLLDAEVGY